MKRNTLSALAVIIALVSCTSTENRENMSVPKPIRMTDGIAMTRSGIQETRLVEREKVYVWANQRQTSDNGVTWTTDWTKDAYLKAWTLEADGTTSDANAYNILTGSTKYYPSKPLAMVAIHGNFTTFTEDETTYPTTVTHTIETDQNTTGNYEKSDLLWWKSDNVTMSDDPVHVNFAHKLSKVEITLSVGDYTEDELDKATVTLNNVLPTVTLNMTNGTLGTASGTPVFITPRKVGKLRYEAVIPPQSKPNNFISVKMNGATVVVDAQTTFSTNERYVYGVTVKKTTDYKRNPLWWMAKWNIKTDGTFDKTTSTSQGGHFTWATALSAGLGLSNPTSSHDGWYTAGKTIEGEKYHLPTKKEFISIVPFISTNSTTNGIAVFYSVPAGNTVVTEEACVFGYDDATKYTNGNSSTNNGNSYKSYWSTYSTAGIRYAIRFLGTPYCSVWRYKYYNLGTTSSHLQISSKLIDQVGVGETAKLSAIMTEISSTSDAYWVEDESRGIMQRDIYACGYNDGSRDRAHYWSATAYDASNAWRLCWFSNDNDVVVNTYSSSTILFSIRPFHDE